MQGMFSRFSKFLLILFLCVLLLPVTVLLTPGHAQAFGSLSENGTAQFMGIGIAPQKILHVSGSGPGSVPLFVRGSDSAGFIIERTPTNRWVLGVNESPTLGNGFVLSTIPTGNTSIPRLMITQGGSVGVGTTTPNSKLQVAGPIATAYKSVINGIGDPITYTASDNDSIISCSPGTDDIYVTLPSAAGCTGRAITVKHAGPSNYVYLQAVGGGNIDNVPVQTLSAWQYMTVVSDGTKWLVIGKSPQPIT